MPPGLTKDVGWQIGVSRALPLPLATVWDFLSSAEGIVLWLGPGATLRQTRGAPYETRDGTRGEVRGYRPYDRIRLTCQPADWDHETTVQVALTATAADRTTLRFHQERLADASERDRQRAHWRAVLGAVEAELAVKAELAVEAELAPRAAQPERRDPTCAERALSRPGTS